MKINTDTVGFLMPGSGDGDDQDPPEPGGKEDNLK